MKVFSAAVRQGFCTIHVAYVGAWFRLLGANSHGQNVSVTQVFGVETMALWHLYCSLFEGHDALLVTRKKSCRALSVSVFVVCHPSVLFCPSRNDFFAQLAFCRCVVGGWLRSSKCEVQK